MNVTIERKLMVVGCRQGSLGDDIGFDAEHSEQFQSVTYCDHPDAVEQASGKVVQPMDVTSRSHVVKALEKYRPTDIVCTVGINRPDGEAGTLQRNLETQLIVNTMGPLSLLVEAIDMWNRSMLPPNTGFNFVAVSSNSARIPRSQSAGYCASKAALSMGIQCVARRWADTGQIKSWVYEPGWINGTPMSDDVRMTLKPGVKPHRIPGGRGLQRSRLAHRIVEDIVWAEAFMNGTVHRLDGGEL